MPEKKKRSLTNNILFSLNSLIILVGLAAFAVLFMVYQKNLVNFQESFLLHTWITFVCTILAVSLLGAVALRAPLFLNLYMFILCFASFAFAILSVFVGLQLTELSSSEEYEYFLPLFELMGTDNVLLYMAYRRRYLDYDLSNQDSVLSAFRSELISIIERGLFICLSFSLVFALMFLVLVLTKSVRSKVG